VLMMVGLAMSFSSRPMYRLATTSPTTSRRSSSRHRSPLRRDWGLGLGVAEPALLPARHSRPTSSSAGCIPSLAALFSRFDPHPGPRSPALRVGNGQHIESRGRWTPHRIARGVAADGLALGVPGERAAALCSEYEIAVLAVRPHLGAVGWKENVRRSGLALEQ